VRGRENLYYYATLRAYGKLMVVVMRGRRGQQELPTPRQREGSRMGADRCCLIQNVLRPITRRKAGDA
jgi:hypothetical protein